LDDAMPSVYHSRGHVAYADHILNLASFAHAVQAGWLPNCYSAAKSLGVHARTVHRYVRFLRDMGAPLIFDPRQNGFYFSRAWSFEKALIRWTRKHRKPIR
jgi:hypothetical protein